MLKHSKCYSAEIVAYQSRAKTLTDLWAPCITENRFEVSKHGQISYIRSTDGWLSQNPTGDYCGLAINQDSAVNPDFFFYSIAVIWSKHQENTNSIWI